MDILEKISAMREEGSRTNRKIAEEIWNQPEKLAFATLRSFAENLEISTTSVIRFARLCGYDGFSELKDAIQNQLQWQITGAGRLYSLSREAEHDNVLLRSFSTDMKNLEETLRLLRERKNTVQRVIDLLISAQRMYIIGMRESFALTHYAWSRFAHIRKGVQVIGAMGNLYEDEVINVSSNDAVLAFTFPRYTRDTIYLLDELRKREAPIIIVTSPEFEVLRKYTDLILSCEFNSISHKSNTIGAFAIINYLSAAAAVQSYGSAKIHLEEIYDFYPNNPTLL